MNIKRLQTRLRGFGFDPGPVDGIIGPRTYAALFGYMAGKQGKRAEDLAKGAVLHFGPHKITTELRLAHFLAQAAHETMGFLYLREIWGPTPAQRRYEGRADLGNVHPGDGKRFLGRGIFHLTGRHNYRAYGRRIGLDLEAHPELAEKPDVSVQIACLYWSDRSLNKPADADHLEIITRAINGGHNGLEARRRALNHAKAVLL